LARREEITRGLSDRLEKVLVEDRLLLLHLGHELLLLLLWHKLLLWHELLGLLLGHELLGLLVGGVERIDEGVDTGAVGTVGDGAGRVDLGGPGTEVGAVLVELKVAVGRVVGVDERVEVGVDRLVNIVVVHELGLGGDGSRLLDTDWGSHLPDGSRLPDRGSLADGRNRGGGSTRGHGLFGVEGSGVEAVCSDRHVVSLDDPESVLPRRVLDGDGVPVLVNVAVLTDPLAVNRCLLSEHDTVLLGKGRPEPTVSCVEPLFFQDFGILWLNELPTCGCHQTGGDKQFTVHFGRI